MSSVIETKRADAVANVQQLCLHELFEAQADERPDKVALVCGDLTLTYIELEERANQLARYIRRLGVTRGSMVGLYFDRSERPIIAILAVLKAGAAYVPIDPVFPVERAKHILAEAGVEVLLSERKMLDASQAFFDGKTIALDKFAREIDKESETRLTRDETGSEDDDLCYVLYTSGTTGRPKGVMTEHRNVVAFTAAFNEAHGINADDKVFQGFSLGFDGSVEEIWMAFSNGGTLVVGTPDVVKFSEEVARVFVEEGVTVFSTVPTFLSMFQQELPTVRIIIVSGEPCPADLIQKWAHPGRRMLNVYGPTETTVNTTVAECVPGKPVTIGVPLRGYDTYILDEKQQPVPPGGEGELYIGGVGVARGYFNQPELTAKQFVPHPFAKNASRKLYRTGDLVSLTDEGELNFIRRIDRQVKIRGFRIELSEIESVLREHTAIHQAVLNVVERDSLKVLAAFVTTSQGNGVLDRDELIGWLRKKLPPYMVPSYLDVLEEIPTLASGKADRSRLPEPRTPLVAANRIKVGPVNELERKIAIIWAQQLKVEDVSCDDDFFLDLGGYSLVAAQVATQLRSEHGLEVAIRDIYRYPTVQKLAEQLATTIIDEEVTETEEQPEARSAQEVFASLSRFTRWTCVSLQTISLVAMYAFESLPLLILALLVYHGLNDTITWPTVLLAIIPVIFLMNPVAILLSIVVKWVVIGRFKPGQYPLWGMYYFRWWLVTRVKGLCEIGLYSGTPIMSLYYRLMGAKIGKNCILDTDDCAIFDLVQIGDDTSIGSQSQLLGYHVADGMLHIGSIEIGKRCFVGTHSALGLNTTMGDDSALDDLSLLPDNSVVPAGEGRRGSPAERAVIDLPAVDEAAAKRRHPFIFGVLHFLAGEMVGESMLWALLPALAVIVAAYVQYGFLIAALAFFVTVPINIISFAFALVIAKRAILWKTKPGTYSVNSFYYLRRWSTDALFASNNDLVSIIGTTIYFPAWFRMMGAKIGHRAEIAAISVMTPDLLDIGDESFLADGAMVGARRFYRGHVQLGLNKVGTRTFVGNNAMVPINTELGDNGLLGVLSTVPGGIGSKMPDNSEWLGSPPFQLPFRQKVGGFEDWQMFKPALYLWVLRYIIDAVRIALPTFITAAAMLAFATLTWVSYSRLPLWGFALLYPLISCVTVFGVAISVAVVKDVLMGKFKPEIKPLWCVYIWLNEVVNGLFEGLALPVLDPLMGTPYFGWFLRQMGCKVGKHCFLETGLLSEFDLVEIGDYAALNFGVVVQNHLFEDRVFKSSYLKIGDNCSVGNMAVVLYDSEMQDGSSIAPMSLLMKGETLLPKTKWIGIPTRQVK